MDGITDAVNGMYERYPYPQLPVRGLRDLLGGTHAKVMGRILATAGLSPGDLEGMDVLDAGCGTGEKSCYFSALGARVSAFDLCGSSIGSARRLAERLGLDVEFNRGDVLEFDEAGRYDRVFSLGVLHHTPDPEKGFRNVARACRMGGTLTVGLYNGYGRFLHRLERCRIGWQCGKDVGRRMAFVERNVLGREFRSAHEAAFAADKYANPHESYHTVGGVLGWFGKCGLERVGTYPALGASPFLSQLRWLARRQGFFVMSGRKVQ